MAVMIVAFIVNISDRVLLHFLFKFHFHVIFVALHTQLVVEIPRVYCLLHIQVLVETATMQFWSVSFLLTVMMAGIFEIHSFGERCSFIPILCEVYVQILQRNSCVLMLALVCS